MAKETKKGIMEMLNGENLNVEEALKNANAMDQEVLEMAQNKMKEEEKKEKADELIRITKRAVYTNIRLKIDAKYTKDTKEVMDAARNKSLELLNDLKEGKLTPSQYESELEKMIDEQIKKVQECGKSRRDDMNELINSYVSSGYYSFSWSNPFNRLNRAIEDNKRN
jgi:hypothetical protein